MIFKLIKKCTVNPNFKKLITFLIILVLLFVIGLSFLEINKLNYIKLREIKLNTVEHPEKLPNKEFAKSLSFGFENSRADIFWLETIQYIGGNAISSAYKKYLFIILDLITELNPYFEKPYKIGMLLLPDYNPKYEKTTKEKELKYIKQAETLGLKGIKNFCDEDKMELIKKENNLQKIWIDNEDNIYKNPCKSYKIPYYLAYIYYFHLNDPKTASDYYKIASANTDSVEGSKILAAIMRGKGGDREKAFLMFLNIGKTLDNSEEKVCSKFGDLLQNKVGYEIFRENKLNGNIIKYVNNSREKLFGSFNEKKDESIASDNECSTYINKSIRELNLHYIEVANNKYKKDNNGKSAKNAKILYDKKYIDYLPIDFQQYEDYGIIYEYNEDTGNFDYSMGNY